MQLKEQRQLGPAEAALHVAKAQGVTPDECSAALWTTHMLNGNFEAAWRESDAIRARGAADPHRFWMGEDLRGRRVIVRCLHGFGDTIQFLRYLPRLRSLASGVVIEVPPRMVELASLLDGVDEVVTWGNGAPGVQPQWDVQVEVMELPYLFRTVLDELPVAIEYLRPPVADLKAAAERMGCRRSLRVGVVWEAGEWNPGRSVPFEHVERMVRSGPAEFWSLQGGQASSQAACLVDGRLMRDAAVCGAGMRVLAAVIANLDVVITVDTLAAHLAGAMGKPVWVLLQHAADWRWMANRSDSPWYPSMRLFRQPAEGDWAPVFDEVRGELEELAGPGCVEEVGCG